MSLIASSIAALFLSAQTPPAPAQAVTPAEAQEAIDKVFDLMRLVGTCSDRFPPEVSQSLTQSFAGNATRGSEGQQDAAQAFQAAYEEGKASPEAATITLDQCMTQLQAMNAEIQTMKARLEAVPTEPGS